MQIETKQYTETKSLNTFNNHIAYDNVTEYILIDTKSYTQEQFEQSLKNAHKTICGFVRYIKKKINLRQWQNRVQTYLSVLRVLGVTEIRYNIRTEHFDKATGMQWSG